MRLYEITTDCLVEFCTLRAFVKARNEREAWAVGYGAALKSNIADSGCVDVKRVKDIPAVKLGIKW